MSSEFVREIINELLKIQGMTNVYEFENQTIYCVYTCPCGGQSLIKRQVSEDDDPDAYYVIKEIKEVLKKHLEREGYTIFFND